MKPLEPRSGVTALVLIVVVVFAGITSLAPVHAASPTISNATVVNQQTSLTLPSGGQLYIYALATDGSASTNYFANSLMSDLYPPVSIKNANGALVAAYAVTTSNTNSYTTSSKSYTIAGASVSGFGNLPAGPRPNTFTAISNVPGTNGVSLYTHVPDPGGYLHYPAGTYLVVIVAIGGDEQCISSISGLPGFVIDASNSNSGNPAIIIGHTYANNSHGGSAYIVSMASSQCAAGQNPNNAADLIEAFVFLPTA